MKKIKLFLPFIAISTLVGCNNNAPKKEKEYLECYSREHYYNKGQEEYYVDYEYNSDHLVDKETKMSYLKSSLQKLGSKEITTHEYNEFKLEKKRNYDYWILGIDGAEDTLFKKEETTWTYDSHNNLKEEIVSSTNFRQETSSFIERIKYDYQYSEKNEILKKDIKHYAKIDDEPEEFMGGSSYQYTYDEKGRLLTENLSGYVNEDLLQISEEHVMTYVDYDTFKTKLDIFYVDNEIKKKVKYTNEFDENGILIKQCIEYLIPASEGDQTVEVFYYYDEYGNVRREIAYGYETTEMGIKTTILHEADYLYYHGKTDKPELVINSGYSKAFGGTTTILKCSYDNYGRIIFEENEEFDGEVKSAKKLIIRTFEYNELIEK